MTAAVGQLTVDLLQSFAILFVGWSLILHYANHRRKP